MKKKLFLAILAIILCFSTAEARRPKKEYTPPVAENGSYRGELSNQTYQPKTVYVAPYYRKDGTRVQGHYRSKPRRTRH